jgi:hypothetical protein
MQNNQNKHEIVKQFIPKLLKVTDEQLQTINEKFHTTEFTEELKNISDALDILISISYLFAKENIESNIENFTKLSNNMTNISDKIDEQGASKLANLCKQILEKIDCLKYQIQLNQIINDRQTIAFTFDKPISKEEVRRILDGNN